MAQSWVSRIGGSPLWRAGLASAFILALAGFAAGVIPQACRNSFVICPADATDLDLLAPIEAAPSAAAPAPAPVVTAATEALPTAPSVDTAMARQQPASITRNDLIAQTFAALDVELTSASGELTARKVRTVAIGPDGMPVVTGGDAPVAAVDEPAPVQVAAAEAPAPAVTETPSSEEPVVEADEPSAVAYAPVRGGTAVVGRQGANVRSLPRTRGSDVLFVLAGGAEVTIVETHQGWHKVVDERGRSGWVWDDLLRR